jgi:hypothetical protein
MMDSCVQNKPPMNLFIEDTRCSVDMQTAEGRSKKQCCSGFL